MFFFRLAYWHSTTQGMIKLSNPLNIKSYSNKQKIMFIFVKAKLMKCVLRNWNNLMKSKNLKY